MKECMYGSLVFVRPGGCVGWPIRANGGGDRAGIGQSGILEGEMEGGPCGPDQSGILEGETEGEPCRPKSPPLIHGIHPRHPSSYGITEVGGPTGFAVVKLTYSVLMVLVSGFPQPQFWRDGTRGRTVLLSP